MSRAIQMWGMAAVPRDLFHLAWNMARGSTRLFSSALFCLWLSTASLVVWVDFATPSAQQAPTDAMKHH